MKWGVTPTITIESVLEHLAFVSHNKGEIIQIVFVGRATATQIVGGNQNEVDVFRVFFNLPSEHENGETAELAAEPNSGELCDGK